MAEFLGVGKSVFWSSYQSLQKVLDFQFSCATGSFTCVRMFWVGINSFRFQGTIFASYVWISSIYCKGSFCSTGYVWRVRLLSRSRLILRKEERTSKGLMSLSDGLIKETLPFTRHVYLNSYKQVGFIADRKRWSRKTVLSLNWLAKSFSHGQPAENPVITVSQLVLFDLKIL